MSIKKAQVTRSEIICDGCNGEIVVNMGEQFETFTNPEGSLEHYHTKSVSGAMKNCRMIKENEALNLKARKQSGVTADTVIGTDSLDGLDITEAERLSIVEDGDKLYRSITNKQTADLNRVTGQDTVGVRNLQRAQQEQLAKKRKKIAESFGMSVEEFRQAWK